MIEQKNSIKCILLIFMLGISGCLAPTSQYSPVVHTSLQECYNNQSYMKEADCVYKKAIETRNISVCDFYPQGIDKACSWGAHASSCDYSNYSIEDCRLSFQSYINQEIVYEAISTSDINKCKNITEEDAAVIRDRASISKWASQPLINFYSKSGCEQLVNNSYNESIAFEAIPVFYQCQHLDGYYSYDTVTNCGLLRAVYFEKKELCNSAYEACEYHTNLEEQGFNDSSCKEYNATHICGWSHYGYLSSGDQKKIKDLLEMPLHDASPCIFCNSPCMYCTTQYSADDARFYNLSENAGINAYDLQDYYYDYALMHLNETICLTTQYSFDAEIECIARIKATKKYLSEK